MYSPLSKILKDYKEGKTEHWETHDKILRLFNDVGHSKQVVCDHEFTHKPLGGNVYCWKCCALQIK